MRPPLGVDGLGRRPRCACALTGQHAVGACAPWSEFTVTRHQGPSATSTRRTGSSSSTSCSCMPTTAPTPRPRAAAASTHTGRGAVDQQAGQRRHDGREGADGGAVTGAALGRGRVLVEAVVANDVLAGGAGRTVRPLAAPAPQRRFAVVRAWAGTNAWRSATASMRTSQWRPSPAWHAAPDPEQASARSGDTAHGRRPVRALRPGPPQPARPAQNRRVGTPVGSSPALKEVVMRALVVYESLFGNTRQVAEAITEPACGNLRGRAAAGGRAPTCSPSAGTSSSSAGRPTRSGSPGRARGSPPRSRALPPRMQQPARHPRVAGGRSPQTRAAAGRDVRHQGRQAEPARLRGPQGGTPTALPGPAPARAGRVVPRRGQSGPLLDGEVERARDWGASLAATFHPQPA